MKRSIFILIVALITSGAFGGFVSAEQVTTYTGDSIVFDGSESHDANGDPLSYIWDFGDGSDPQAGPAVSHIYHKDGRYSVSLTVDDNRNTECSRDTATVDVVVKNK